MTNTVQLKKRIKDLDIVAELLPFPEINEYNLSFYGRYYYRIAAEALDISENRFIRCFYFRANDIDLFTCCLLRNQIPNFKKLSEVFEFNDIVKLKKKDVRTFLNLEKGNISIIQILGRIPLYFDEKIFETDCVYAFSGVNDVVLRIDPDEFRKFDISTGDDIFGPNHLLTEPFEVKDDFIYLSVFSKDDEEFEKFENFNHFNCELNIFLSINRFNFFFLCIGTRSSCGGHLRGKKNPISTYINTPRDEKSRSLRLKPKQVNLYYSPPFVLITFLDEGEYAQFIRALEDKKFKFKNNREIVFLRETDTSEEYEHLEENINNIDSTLIISYFKHTQEEEYMVCLTYLHESSHILSEEEIREIGTEFINTVFSFI